MYDVIVEVELTDEDRARATNVANRRAEENAKRKDSRAYAVGAANGSIATGAAAKPHEVDAALLELAVAKHLGSLKTEGTVVAHTGGRTLDQETHRRVGRHIPDVAVIRTDCDDIPYENVPEAKGTVIQTIEVKKTNLSPRNDLAAGRVNSGGAVKAKDVMLGGRQITGQVSPDQKKAYLVGHYLLSQDLFEKADTVNYGSPNTDRRATVGQLEPMSELANVVF